MNKDELLDLAAALRYTADKCKKAANEFEWRTTRVSLNLADETAGVVQAICLLVTQGKVQEFRKWIRTVQDLVLQRLVEEHGYNSRKIAEVLGKSYHTSRRYAYRHGVKFKDRDA